MLSKRILSTFIFLPILVFFLLFASPVWQKIFFYFLISIAAYEWSAFITDKIILKLFYILSTILIIICLQKVYLPIIILPSCISALIITILFAFEIKIKNRDNKEHERFSKQEQAIRIYNGLTIKLPSVMFTTVIFILGIFTMTSLYYSCLFLLNLNPYLLIYFLSFIFIVDTSCYILGSIIGKNKLAPNISPNKTIEGALAGIAFALVYSISFLMEWPDGLYLSKMWFIAHAFSLCVISMIGDLSISFIKRINEIKDTGRLFPGHGGLWDRLDSIYLTIPLFTMAIFYSLN